MKKVKKESDKLNKEEQGLKGFENLGRKKKNINQILNGFFPIQTKMYQALQPLKW